MKYGKGATVNFYGVTARELADKLRQVGFELTHDEVGADLVGEDIYHGNVVGVPVAVWEMSEREANEEVGF
jgi:hypothetical protein